jgi:hypothetical protein
MDDHPVEAPEELSPELAPARCSSRQEVVRGEDRGRPRTKEEAIELVNNFSR